MKQTQQEVNKNILPEFNDTFCHTYLNFYILESVFTTGGGESGGVSGWGVIFK